MNKENNQEVYELDLLRTLKVIWRYILLILASAIICGALAFGYAYQFISPQYQAQALMYVNNGTVNIGGTKVIVGGSDVSGARSVVSTYLVILKSRTTLNEVIEKAELDYTYEQLVEMVNAESLNGTEVFRVLVTSSDPQEAKLIANTITEVLPNTIGNVLRGADVRLVDYAVTPTHRLSPNYTRYTAFGLIIGALLSIAFVVIRDLLDDVVHDTDILHQTFSDIPVLSMIPDLNREGSGNYQYDYSHGYQAKRKVDAKRTGKEGNK